MNNQSGIENVGGDMAERKFNPAVCDTCSTRDCITKCQYINLPPEAARVEQEKMFRGERSRILTECVTCCGCEEYCPRNNHPFFFISEQQEKLDINPVPKPVANAMVNILSPVWDSKSLELKGTVLNMCNFPMLAGTIRGKLFKDVSMFSGVDSFCNLMYMHFARSSATMERVPGVIDNIMEKYLKDNGVSELVCYHDECYGTYTKWAPINNVEVPFKPVHFFEFIHRRLVELKDEIKPLNVKVAYQRSCSSRITPETDRIVDDIFALIGVERVARVYDRQNALCCGAAIEMHQKFELMEENQDRNVNDMKEHGATYCAFSCPLCFFTLMGKTFKKGIMPILMSDLCLKALGE